MDIPDKPTDQPASPAAAPDASAACAAPPLVRPGHYCGDEYKMEESVGYLMKVAFESMARQIDARMADYSLTDAQWRPLLMLYKHKCRTAAEMARSSGHDTGALTRMLDRLEDKGLLQRVRSADDRRVQVLELTPEGQRTAAMVPYVIADVLNAHLTDLSAQEVVVLKDLLRRMIAAGQHAAGRAPGGAE